MSDDSRTKVAANLRAILDMATRLHDEAEHRASDPDMPGGDALVNLAGVANLEAWEHQQATRERLGRAYTSAEDEDPDEAWSPFQMLEYWSEAWRRELDMDYDMRHTITTEARFLSNPDVLAWAWGNEAGWDDFAADMAKARTKLENVVRAGIRTTRSRIVCDKCDQPKRLQVIYGEGDHAAGYISPCCHARYTPDEAKRAHAKQMRSTGADRWVKVREAVDALRVQGWQERTVLKWLEPLRPRDKCTECGETWPHREHAACPRKVHDGAGFGDCGGMLVTVWSGDRDAIPEGYCDVATRRTFVRWPDLWRRHLTEKQKREQRVSA